MSATTAPKPTTATPAAPTPQRPLPDPAKLAESFARAAEKGSSILGEFLKLVRPGGVDEQRTRSAPGRPPCEPPLTSSSSALLPSPALWLAELMMQPLPRHTPPCTS